MPATYEPIATTTISDPAINSITFSSIPSTYTDLAISFVWKGDYCNPFLQVNGDTATNYSNTRVTGNGSAAASSRQSTTDKISLSPLTGLDTTGLPAFTQIDLFSYAGSNFKTALINTSVDLNGSGSTVRMVGLWRSTSAITSITLGLTTSSSCVGTTATLYGIKNA
jgi:hypothetical protein